MERVKYLQCMCVHCAYGMQTCYIVVHSSALTCSEKLFSLGELMDDFMFGLPEASSIPSLLLSSVFQSADNH